MKKILAIACSAALLHIGSPAQSQTLDSTLARNDTNGAAKKSEENVAGGEKASNKMPQVEENTVSTEDKSAVKFKVPVSKVSKKEKGFSWNDKVGPNGEELWMKRNKYYYTNTEGKKVKAKIRDLKNGPKHS